MRGSESGTIQGFIDGEEAAHGTVSEWIRSVVSARLWVEGVSAEDVVSDTILKLLLNFRAGRFRNESSLKTYIQRITRFTIINAVRRHEAEQRCLQALQDDAPGGKTPAELTEEKEQARIFSRIFSLIDERCKEIWHLIFKEGLTYREIGRRTGVSEGAVRTRVFRCKEEAIEIRQRIS